jgi:hypothetical protein
MRVKKWRGLYFAGEVCEKRGEVGLEVGEVCQKYGEVGGKWVAKSDLAMCKDDLARKYQTSPNKMWRSHPDTWRMQIILWRGRCSDTVFASKKYDFAKVLSEFAQKIRGAGC